MIQIFTDGASRGNPGPAGIGGLIIHNEETIFELSQYLGTQTNNVAEYSALFEILKKLIVLVPSSNLTNEEIICMADSELMIKQLNGEYKIKHPNLIPIFQNIKKLTKSIPKIKFKHIPREENKEADQLANMAIDCADTTDP